MDRRRVERPNRVQRQRDLDCPALSVGICEPGATDTLKNKIAFINAEYSLEYLGKLPAKTGFGYWIGNEHFASLREIQLRLFPPDLAFSTHLEWYAPYFISHAKRLAGWPRVIPSMETAEKADPILGWLFKVG